MFKKKKTKKKSSRKWNITWGVPRCRFEWTGEMVYL